MAGVRLPKLAPHKPKFCQPPCSGTFLSPAILKNKKPSRALNACRFARFCDVSHPTTRRPDSVSGVARFSGTHPSGLFKVRISKNST
ncbi:MAG: hypothetical protein IJU79_07445 [Desulfovibrionaceae bacterium]|nr:hypothetical protein [Desulfovibrionaceae bacterium]